MQLNFKSFPLRLDFRENHGDSFSLKLAFSTNKIDLKLLKQTQLEYLLFEGVQ